jgi:signal transduction histidine kinase
LFEPDEVYLIVSDRGVGIQDKAESSIRSGWGLVGIRERAESVGGRFRVYSPPEGGTVVTISIPIEVTTVGEEQEIFHERYPIDVG